jgi:D-lactate dehydrogenase
MAKVGFFSVKQEEKKIIEENFSQEEISIFENHLSEENLPQEKDFEIISVFVGSEVNKNVIDYFPHLKMINTRSTGFDHIDIKYAREKNIIVTYVPGYGDNTVAEYAFGLLLNLTRKIYKAIDQIKETESFSLEGLQGIDLKGKILGVIGTGRIGKEAIKIGRGFGMIIYAYDPYPDYEFAKIFDVKYVSLEELLKNADCITIHCPLLPSTKHLINEKNIELLKDGVYLVNTARGGIVETSAIIKGLKMGKLEGVALDVLEEETEIKDEMEYLMNKEKREEELKTILENHILMKHPKVLITPHNAFNTKEALGRILKTCIETIKAFNSGQIINTVPYEN